MINSEKLFLNVRYTLNVCMYKLNEKIIVREAESRHRVIVLASDVTNHSYLHFPGKVIETTRA